MGTQGSITVYDEDGKDIANIVTQYDGYDLHEWVERFVSGKQLTNGISNDYDFNGMGDLAARLIAALKNQRYKRDIGQPVKPGNVYLYDTPYETDYHITLVYQGEGKKPKMTVSTPEWTDNYYDNTMLPSLGEANVRMQGAETFNAESGEPIYVVKRDYTGAETDYLIGTESYIRKEMDLAILIGGRELGIDYQNVSLEEIFDTVFDAYESDEYGSELVGKFTDGMYLALRRNRNGGVMVMMDGGEYRKPQTLDYTFDLSKLGFKNEANAETFNAESGEPIYVVRRDYTGGEIWYVIGTEEYIRRELAEPIDITADEGDIDYEGMSLEEIFDTVFEYSDEYGPDLVGKFTDGMYLRLKSYDGDKDVGVLQMFDGETIDYTFDLSRLGFKHESNAESFNADYSLYDRKAKQKVGVKSGYDDYKDAYDDWENEIIKEYPNRVSENEWIVIDTHSAETFEAEQCKHEEYYVIGMDGDEWNEGGENFAMLEIECESCGVRGKGETNLSYDTAPNREHNRIWWEDIGFEAETFNAYKVAPALSSYSKDELISSKAGPQGSASYDEMVYDPIAQDRLSAEECSKCVVDRELSGLGKGSSIGFHTSSRSACPSWCINAQDRLSAESFASDEERRLKAFAKKIENEKKKLVKKAKRSGFYENFGQKEVRKLEDSISDLDYYEQQKYQEMIRDFDNWADSIDLRGLEHYAETFASDEYRLCEICESTHHENYFRHSDDEEQTMTPKGEVCDGCFGDILFDDFQNADDRDWAKQYLESKGFQQHPIQGSFEDGFGAESFASETSSTLKSMGYVAGTIGVGYLIFQRFVKDRLNETMNQ